MFYVSSMDSRSPACSASVGCLVAGGVRFISENNFAIATRLEFNRSIVFPPRLLAIDGFVLPVRSIQAGAFSHSSLNQLSCVGVWKLSAQTVFLIVTHFPLFHLNLIHNYKGLNPKHFANL
jgi:hypothetical protein